jgi:hypothetical protein
MNGSALVDGQWQARCASAGREAVCAVWLLFWVRGKGAVAGALSGYWQLAMALVVPSQVSWVDAPQRKFRSASLPTKDCLGGVRCHAGHHAAAGASRQGTEASRAM